MINLMLNSLWSNDYYVYLPLRTIIYRTICFR